MRKVRSFLESFKLIFETLFVIIIIIPSVLLLERCKTWESTEKLLKEYIKNHVIKSKRLINKKGFKK